jgi:F-type H+-transporting ATPase subunit gamma
MRRQNRNMVASFTNLGETPRFESVLPLVKLVIDGFSDGTYDRVFLAYTDFISALRQQPKVLPLLPLTFEALSQSAVDPDGTPSAHHPPKGEYLFEPDSHAVLDRLLPRVVEMMLYQAVLESSASEHSARMMTMRTASDAASDMINDLSFTFNQMRQAGITREIAEISGGKAALEGGNCTRVIGDRL